MLRCWPGCIARITGCDLPQERADLGHLVEVRHAESISTDPRPHWHVKGITGALTVVLLLGGNWTGDILRGSHAIIADQHLTPLGTPPVMTVTISEAEQPACLPFEF